MTTTNLQREGRWGGAIDQEELKKGSLSSKPSLDPDYTRHLGEHVIVGC